MQTNNSLPTRCLIIRHAYTPPSRDQIGFPEESLYTKQSFAEECDINTIMAKYQFNGELPNLMEVEPQYLDCTDMDYQSGMQFIAGAQSLFNELPSKIRNQFENDPGQFLDFVHDKNNRPILAEWGLLKVQNAAPILTPQPNQTNAAKADPVTPQFQLEKSP